MLKRTFLVIAVLTAAACAAKSIVSPDLQRAPASSVTEIRNVTVVALDQSPNLLQNYTVVVRDSLIEALGPAQTFVETGTATVIDGRGKYLMPGLVDMHTHMRRADLPKYISFGITRVRNMWGTPDVREMQKEIDRGDLDGPTIYSLSPGLDATPGQWPLTQFVDKPSQADSVVAQQAAAGYTTLKVYNSLSLASYDAIVTAARKYGMSVAGHVPFAVPVEHAIASGQLSIEHLSGYYSALGNDGGNPDVTRLGTLIEQTRAAGTWVCPTLAIQAQLNPAGTVNRAKAARMFFQAGVPLLLGTDAGIDVTAAGMGLRQEIESFASAGFSPIEILKIATINSARYLKLEGKIGTMRQGAIADLVLLDANPLNDAVAATRPKMVFIRGRRFAAP